MPSPSRIARPSPRYHPTWHVTRDSSTYFAAQGDVVIRQLRGCTNASGSEDDNAQVWPANMQGVDDFKQIGYANNGGTSMNWWATCCSGFTSNVTGMSLSF